jgi:hypothetical protein
MRDLLQRIRTRVDRLVADVACDGPHVLTKVSFVLAGEPVPDWPRRWETCARCGAELEYCHIVQMQDDAALSPRP